MSTYTPIASQTASGSESSITFSSIPQGYTDLVLVFLGKVNSESGDLGLRFNSDIGSNYSTTWLSSQAGGISGRSNSANSITATEYAYLDSTGYTQSNINFQNYSNSTTYKTALVRSGKANYNVDAKVGLWRNTNAITSITVFTTGSNPAFTSGSTFSIYGIQVGQAAQKAQGGNIVTTDGTYVYHTFTSSGSFIPSQALTADYLVVAGGGGGGGSASDGNGGGGGGAGGLRSTVTATGGGGSLESALSLTAKSYSVIVGAGGAGGLAAGSTKGSSGNNSIFGTITSTGGGGGAGSSSGQNTPLTGGSGGGGAPYVTAPNGAAATTSPVQGYAGGNPINSGSYGSGGGGGAGAVGANAGGTGGNGGNGVAVSISGSSVTYAGGGGGGVYGNYTSGSGGTGGGGNAGAGNGTNPGNAGTTNTGSGGGGSSAFNTGAVGGNGGSGIVIIRYAI